MVSHTNITINKIILKVLKHPNYFYYINGLIIDTQEKTFQQIRKYHDYIKIFKPIF